MKLESRDYAPVKFRRELPAYKSGNADPPFIEIDAKPAGVVNPAYMAQTDQARLELGLQALERAKIKDDPAALLKFENEYRWQPVADNLYAIYHTCVTGWRCNLKDGDGLIAITAENFLGLVDEAAHSLALREVMIEFAHEVMAAGQKAHEELQATVKN